METKPSFEQYRLTEERTIRISDRFPVCCVERTAQKIELIDRQLSEDESQQAALISAREEAMQSIPKNAMILNQYGSIQTIDGITKAVVIITAEETIGRTEEYLNGRGTSEYDRTH
jgi:translation elongation factor EF-Tu-like GTPase